MQHYQLRLACGLCQRKFVADVTSWGTPHQSIQSITCIECCEKHGVKLLDEGEVVQLTAERPPPDPAAMDRAMEAFKAGRDSERGSKS